jgi:APA family basic amino acid/polyamine antiporter
MELRDTRTRIGLAGTVFIIVGFVMGVNIFVLPAELAAISGPAVFLGFAIAAIPALLGCFVAAQAGNIFPTSGCAYVGTSTVLSPFWGFILVWNIVIAMTFGVPALAYGFAEYLVYFPVFEGLGRTSIAATCVLLFGAVNLVGVKTTVGLQTVMIVIYLAITSVFCFGGFAAMDFGLLDPLFPDEIYHGARGWGALLQTAVAATFSFSGFMVITEIGDQIANPKRTIPLALMIGFAIVAVLFLLTAFVLPGLIPWQELADEPAPVAAAAALFLPAWFATFVAINALLGAATSINALFLMQSRDIYVLARDGVFPSPLATVSRRFEQPTGAILFCTALTFGSVLLGRSIAAYAVTTAIAILVINMLAGVFVLLAPQRAPEFFERARFKLGPVWLKVVALPFIAVSAVLLVAALATDPTSFGIYLVLLVVGVGFYLWRLRVLTRRGVDLTALLRKDLAYLLERDDAAAEAARD